MRRVLAWLDDRLGFSTAVKPLIEHPVPGDDGGVVRIVERDGRTRVLSAAWSSAWGLAWSPSGNEVWFTAARTVESRHRVLDEQDHVQLTNLL